MNKNKFTTELKGIQKASKALKDGFKKTESRSWSASSFGAELCFQTTHLCCSVLNQQEKSIFIAPLEGVDKGLTDEIADVLFNIMNTANFLGINIEKSLNSLEASKYKALFSTKDTQILAMNLVIQAGNLWDTLFRQDGYKHKVLGSKEALLYMEQALTGTLVALLATAEAVDVSLAQAFREMNSDASQFLGNYDAKHKIQE